MTVLRHGSLDVMLSAEILRPDLRKTHTRDEIDVVVHGQGVLFHDGKRTPFAAADCLFVAAGVEHCFEDFSDDLTVWVIFYGLSGGELLA